MKGTPVPRSLASSEKIVVGGLAPFLSTAARRDIIPVMPADRGGPFPQRRPRNDRGDVRRENLSRADRDIDAQPGATGAAVVRADDPRADHEDAIVSGSGHAYFVGTGKGVYARFLKSFSNSVISIA